MSIEGDSKNLNMELRVLVSNLATEREKFTEIIANQIKALESQLKNISNTNALIQSIPKEMEDKLKASIPQIAAELNATNKEKLKRLEEEYLKTTEKYAELFTSAETKLSQQVKKLDLVNAKRVKRFFLGVGITVFISVFASVSASYLMMRSFPLKAIINHPENIILNESQVSLWGTDNVKVLKNTK